MDMYGGAGGPTVPIVSAAPAETVTETTRDQLLQAENYLNSLRSDRARSCAELESESQRFLATPSTPEQDRRFRLVYQLVRYQIHTYTHSMYTILQEKLEAMARVQAMVGSADDDSDVKALTIALVNGRIVDATISQFSKVRLYMDMRKVVEHIPSGDAKSSKGSTDMVIERALESLRELSLHKEAETEASDISDNKTGLSQNRSRSKGAALDSGDPSQAKTAKRSRLPAAAVKEMRNWLDRHWDDPVPNHEEKEGFAERHGITTKQVENWFINIRMREWRPAMRRALFHAEETGSYAEFSRLLKHTADGNVFKKFLEERENGEASSVPPPSLQRFIGADNFAAFAGDKRRKAKRRI